MYLLLEGAHLVGLWVLVPESGLCENGCSKVARFCQHDLLQLMTNS